MRIRLLKEGYFNNEELKQQIYTDFLNGEIEVSKDYFSEDIVNIDEPFEFPIYLANAPIEDFVEAISVLRKNMVHTERSIHLDRRFWHSYLIQVMRNYILDHYPKVKESLKEFNNIVLKKFDWENYIYKCMIAAEYIENSGLTSEEEKIRISEIIFENLDLYNYLIKYNIFRNKQFILNLLMVIDEEGLSEELKKKVENEAGKDLRLSRMIVYEMNKRYPVVMYPLLDKEELRDELYNMKKIYS